MAVQTLGHIFGISDAILGLTIFAMGNSLGDLVANATVAVRSPAPPSSLFADAFLRSAWATQRWPSQPVSAAPCSTSSSASASQGPT